MDLKNIISVSGMSGLYKIVSHSRAGIIVESMSDKKRSMVSANHRVVGLDNVSVFTKDKDILLEEVLLKMKAANTEAVDTKVSADQLNAKFKAVLPDYDNERVHDSEIKKMFSWFNILLSHPDAWVEKPAGSEDDESSKPSGIPFPGDKSKHFAKDTARVNPQGGHTGRSAIPQKKGGG